MTLFDTVSPRGTVIGIGGDPKTHRRLTDMGLLGSNYTVKARRKGGLLVDYGDFSAVTAVEICKCIFVVER